MLLQTRGSSAACFASLFLTQHDLSSSLAELLPLFQIKDQAEQNPNDQHDVALFSKVDTGQTGNRDQLKAHESQAESYACDGHSS